MVLCFAFSPSVFGQPSYSQKSNVLIAGYDDTTPLVFVCIDDLPPMVYLEDGKHVGIIADLAEAIAAQMKQSVEIKYVEWSKAQQMVLEGQADAAVHINPTEDRKKRFSFSKDLLATDFAIFVKHDRVDVFDVHSLKGLRVGTLNEGLCFNLLSRQPEINIVTYPEILEGFHALVDEKLDAVVIGRQVGSYLLAAHGIRGVQITGDPVDSSNSAIAVKKGNEPLLKDIDRALREIKANGTYANVMAKWEPKEVVFQTREQSRRQSNILLVIEIISIILLTLILLFLFWNRSLNRMVQLRTAELQKSNSQFGRLSDSNILGIIFWNTAGEITDANDEFLRMLGYSREDLISGKLNWTEMTPPKYAESDERALREVMSTGTVKHIEKEFYHMDGHCVPVVLGAAMLEGTSAEGICYVVDLTEHKQMKTALSESEALMKTLLNAPLEIMMLLDRDGTILSINEGGAHRFELSADEMVGQNIFLLMDDESSARRKRYGEQVYETKQPVQFRDGRAGSFFSNSIYPVFDDLGEVVNIAVFSADITDQKMADEKVLAYQERLRELSAEQTLIEERERKRIAGELHDSIGQTLAFARARLSVLKKDLSTSKATEAFADTSDALLQAIRDTKNIVFDLSAPSMNEIGLAAAIEEWLKERVDGVNGITTKMIDHCGRVPMKEDQRAIIFRNVRELLINATKHSQADNVSVEIQFEGGMLLVSIEDDGVGMELDESGIEVLKPGSFGLFSIRERMSSMGGSLEITSSPSNGFKAKLSVPLNETDETG